MTTSTSPLELLFFEQDGVVSRKQLLGSGLPAAFVRRKLRRGEWVRLGSGVYVNHTGPLTWRQRAWAAVLGAQRAALSHQSALCLSGLAKPAGPIHIAVGRKDFAPTREGVVVHQYAQIESRAMWNRQPPRIRIEHAVLDVAGDASTELEAIATIADSVQARVTTPARLLAALDERARTPRRKLIGEALRDVSEGACSVLERGYLTRVERPHGLPNAHRQTATRSGRRGFRDVEYRPWRLVVELDGRFAHDDARSRDRDLERDLDAAVGCDLRTLRLGWGQVYDRPCTTARKVAAMLTGLGWTGTMARCPRCTERRGL